MRLKNFKKRDLAFFLNRKRIFLAFSNVYGVNLDEIKEDLEFFSTFNEFFTREIKPRKINPEDSNEIVGKNLISSFLL